MMKRRLAEPINAARIRRIEGSFSWIDHRFIPMMVDLGRDENLLYLWLIAVGDRNGVSFYSDEKTASRLKISVSEIEAARGGLIAKGFVAYRGGVSQVLALPVSDPPEERRECAIERRANNQDPLSEGCRRPVIPADCEEARNLSQHIVQNILRQLERA